MRKSEAQHINVNQQVFTLTALEYVVDFANLMPRKELHCIVSYLVRRIEYYSTESTR